MKYSLHLGFNYPNTGNALNGCWNDARMMARAAKSFGYRPQIVLDNRRLGKGQIMQILRRFILKPNGSQLFLSYSGHGSSIGAGSDAHERDGKNEALVMPDFNLLVDNEFYAILKLLPPQSRLFIVLDCCHSGTGCDFPYLLDAGRRQWTLDRADTVIPNKNPIVVLSGCLDSQYSYEHHTGNIVRGALTVAFNTAVGRMRRRHQRLRMRRRARGPLHINCFQLLNTTRRLINDHNQIPVVSTTKQIPVNYNIF